MSCDSSWLQSLKCWSLRQTRGGSDRGVDAVFVDDRNGGNSIHIFQFKYVDTFAKSKNNFPSGEIDKISAFLAELLDEDKNMERTCNDLLWNKVQEIWEALNKKNPSIEIHFCGNLDIMEPGEKKRAELTFGKYKYCNVHHHSLESVSNLLITKKAPKISKTIPVVDKDYFDRTDGNVRGLICTMEATEIVKAITDPNNPSSVLGDIFDSNVRIYLSRTNKINKKIIETALSENNNLFWYLNNGITITCESFSYAKGKRNPFVELTNMQIVNGGQTSNALFEAHAKSPEKIEDVLVLVRIIETKSPELSLSIAESTNSQTPIKSRDLMSNDEIQKKLAEAFLGMGLCYERKARQHADKARSKRIDALSAGQAYLAYKLEMPEVAKKDRGRIFADLYETVFTDEITADELLASYRLLEKIEARKIDVQRSIKNNSGFDKSQMFLIDGAYHVLFAVGQICDKAGLDRNDLGVAERLIPAAIDLVSSLVNAEQKNDESFSFNRFFKDARTKRKIATLATQ